MAKIWVRSHDPIPRGWPYAGIDPVLSTRFKIAGTCDTVRSSNLAVSVA
jgi:hypothetical protein